MKYPIGKKKLKKIKILFTLHNQWNVMRPVTAELQFVPLAS